MMERIGSLLGIRFKKMREKESQSRVDSENEGDRANVSVLGDAVLVVLGVQLAGGAAILADQRIHGARDGVVARIVRDGNRQVGAGDGSVLVAKARMA